MLKKRAPEEISKADKRIVTIANVAAKLFSSKGYIETSIDDVAGAAKTSKGAIYYYFSSKGEILDHILSTFMDTVLANAGRAVQEIDDPKERIRTLILRHVKTYAGNVYLAKALLHEAHNLPKARLREINAKEKEYFRIVSEVISSYLQGGVDKDGLTVLTFNLLGMCNWIYSWYDPRKAIDPEQLAQLIFHTFVNGLSGPAAGTGSNTTSPGRQKEWDRT